MKRYNKLRIIKIAMLCLLGLMMSGCGELPEDATADLAKAFNERAQENISVVNELANSGFITAVEKEEWTKSILNNVNSYTDMSNMSEKDIKGLTKGISEIDRHPLMEDKDAAGKFQMVRDDNNKDMGEFYNGVKKEVWNKTYLPAIIKQAGYWGSVGCISSSLEAIPIVETGYQDLINKRLKVPIYVLKTQTDINDVDNNMGLDGIIEMVAKATEDPENIDDGILANYFQNTGMSLLDLSETTLEVIKETESNGSGSNKLGSDLIINQCGLDAMHIRLKEFNPDVVDMLYKVAGSGNGKFIFSNGKLYLMEYPVYKVSDIDKISDSEYNIGVAKSDLYISLLTQEVYRRNSKGQASKIEMVDGYYTFKGAKNAEAKSQASFVLWGKADELNLSFNFNGNNLDSLNSLESVDGGYARIVLRDYLEGTFAPDIVSGENVGVFGRKIRINRLRSTDEGDSQGCLMDEPFAYYVDNNGNKLGELPDIYIDDVADFDSLAGKSPKVSYIQRGNLNKDNEGVTHIENEDKLKNSLGKIDELTWESTNSIGVTGRFPGTKVGKQDNSGINKHLFYVIPVTSSPFETGLYSKWIASDDSSQSLNWWNTWLSDNNFNYQINVTALEDWLMGNYTFELNQQGIIILDLETIAKIQEDYNEIDDTNYVKNTRTIFVIIGWLLITLSMITIAAWAVDVNIDIGFNLLEKITFGHWVAVKYDDELPPVDYSNRSYVTLKNVIIRAIIMVLIGIVLITIPVTNIAVKLIEIFGGIADLLSGLFTGL